MSAKAAELFGVAVSTDLESETGKENTVGLVSRERAVYAMNQSSLAYTDHRSTDNLPNRSEGVENHKHCSVSIYQRSVGN